MPTDPQRKDDAQEDAPSGEDLPIPPASEDEVLDETARLAREGRKELESDPKERKPAAE